MGQRDTDEECKPSTSESVDELDDIPDVQTGEAAEETCGECDTARHEEHDGSSVSSGEDAKCSKEVATDSEFPEAGTVWRQTQELERRDSQKREQDHVAKVTKRSSQIGTRSSKQVEQAAVMSEVGSDDSEKSLGGVEAEMHGKVSACKPPSDSPNGASSSHSPNGDAAQPASTPVTSDKRSAGSVSAYPDEDITWSVGTVKQHKAAIESKVQEQNTTPLTTRKDSEYRMTNDTLRLIREIGSVILNSPARPALPGGASGQGLVHRVTRDVELKSGVPAVRKRIIIVEKTSSDPSASEEESKPQRSDAAGRTRSPNGSQDTDAISRPRSPNIHSIEVKSVAIPKEVFSRVEAGDTCSEGSGEGAAGGEKRRSGGSSPRSCVQMTERKIIIEEKLQSLPECVSNKHEQEVPAEKERKTTSCGTSGSSTAATSSSDSDSEKKGSAGDDVKVRELVGIFELKDEASSNSRTSSLTSPQEGGSMAELGLTFQPSKKGPSSAEGSNGECKIKSKRHTWTRGDKTPSSTTSSTKSQKRRSSCKNGKQTGAQDTRTDSGRTTAPPCGGGAAQGKTNRTRTISEPPGKEVKGQGHDHNREAVERKTSLPAKVVGCSGDKATDSDDTAPEQEESASTSGLLRQKSAGSVRSYAGPSPLVSPGDGGSQAAGGPGRPTNCSGLNPVRINCAREPEARRTRKQHGKTHPLTRLTNAQDGQTGRSYNPVYNTM